ncbi:uncharacterized protein N7503_003992 [Penicillium pulvis]|uniref:uncharacterized protein n=1 Tax=Penicillium pulvis TaxID=1562058 RepID=UPI00254665A6|nr:uncharacterized protein N7503_003992 [Penicillium pulvis]KAJ5806390.1 hypothetical protein N7503_003992 [Penicillium pulvis]
MTGDLRHFIPKYASIAEPSSPPKLLYGRVQPVKGGSIDANLSRDLGRPKDKIEDFMRDLDFCYENWLRQAEESRTRVFTQVRLPESFRHKSMADVAAGMARRTHADEQPLWKNERAIQASL